MSNRIIVCLLLVLTASFLFAGGEKDKGAATRPAEISMCVWGMPWENKLYTDILIPKFEAENTSVKVTFHHFENYQDKVPMLFAGGEMPDVVRILAQNTSLWVDKGMFLSLDDYMDKPKSAGGINRKDFIPTMMDIASVKGKIYAIPQDINFRGLMYNKALFQKGGVGNPTYDWTWEDLKIASKKLDFVEGEDQYGFGAWYSTGGFRVLQGLADGTIWNKSLDDPLINKKGGVEALQLWRDLIGDKDPYLVTGTPSSGAIGGLGADKYFEMGKRAMHMDGMWRPPSVTKNAPELDFGMVPVPRKAKGVGHYHANHGCLFGVNSKSKFPEASWKLARSLVSDGAGVTYWRQTWVGPPARYSDHKDPDFKNLIGIPGVVPGLDTADQYQERCQWVIDILAGKHAKPDAYWIKSLNNTELDDRLIDAIEAVLLNKADIQKTLDKAVKETRDYIKSQ